MVGSIYCIIGATGFLGRHLVQRLTAENTHHIRCLSRGKQVPQSSIEWLVGDLHEARALQNVVARDAIVMNLAFDTAASHEQNIASARLLARTCIAAGVQRLVHVSTAAVTGGARGNTIDETTICAPCSGYERAKLAVERTLTAESGGRLCTTVIRPTAVFGQGGRNLLKLARQTATGNHFQRQLMAYLHGMRRMNLVAVENVIAAVTYLASVPVERAEGTFLISDDDSDNNNYAYVASRLARAFGKLPLTATSPSLPAPLLRLLLQVCGRSNINPHRRYSCAKLLGTGFARPVAFEKALDDFAAFLSGEWARTSARTG